MLKLSHSIDVLDKILAESVNIEVIDNNNAIPNEIEKKAKEFTKNVLMKRFNDYRDRSKEDHEKMLKCLKDFKRFAETKEIPFISNHILPIIYNSVKMLWGRLLDGVLNANKLAIIEPISMLPIETIEEFNEYEMKAKLAEKAYNNVLELGDQKLEFSLFLLDLLIFGRGWLKTGYIKEFSFNETGFYLEKEYPKAIRVSPFKVFIDPLANGDVEKARDIHQVILVNKEEIERMIDCGMIVKNSFEILKDQEKNYYNNQIEYEIDRLSFNANKSNLDGYYELVETTAYFDPDNNNKSNLYTFLWVKNTGDLLGVKRNTYKHNKKPYILAKLIPVPEMPFGIGLAESLHSIQKSASNTLNQLLENLASVNIRHLVLRGQVDEIALSRSIPNGIIRCDSLDAYKPITGTPLPYDMWRILDYWTVITQETSNITPIINATKAASTATGTSILNANAQLQFDMINALINNFAFTPCHRQLFSNFQENVEMAIIVELEDKSLIPITRDIIQGKFFVKSASLDTLMKRRQRALDTIPLIAQMVQAKVNADYAYLLKKLFEDLNLYEPERIFPQEGNPTTPSPMPLEGIQGQNYPMEPKVVMPEMDNINRPQIIRAPSGELPTDLVASNINFERNYE
ncbi:MAG: hypothetical protein QXJ06_00560 [Candidatus Aenigmatarchaeota archaeon]